MQYLKALAVALALAPAGLAVPTWGPKPSQPKDVNPYVGRQVHAPREYAKKLDETIKYFNKKKDFLNAARTRTVQKIPTFVWVSRTSEVCYTKVP